MLLTKVLLVHCTTLYLNQKNKSLFILQSFKEKPQQFHGFFQRIMEISLASEEVCIIGL